MSRWLPIPRPLAVLSDGLVEQARRHYHERFDVGRDSRGNGGSGKE